MGLYENCNGHSCSVRLLDESSYVQTGKGYGIIHGFDCEATK